LSAKPRLVKINCYGQFNNIITIVFETIILVIITIIILFACFEEKHKMVIEALHINGPFGCEEKMLGVKLPLK
jgi:hypothetical protein